MVLLYLSALNWFHTHRYLTGKQTWCSSEFNHCSTLFLFITQQQNFHSQIVQIASADDPKNLIQRQIRRGCVQSFLYLSETDIHTHLMGVTQVRH